MSEYFKLTEACQKEVSRLQGLCHKQREVIKRELAVQEEKGDTFVCARARTSLAFSTTKLESSEAEYQRVILKAEADYKRALQIAEDEYKNVIEKYKKNITFQEDIINRETSKKSATLIRAETEINSLQIKIKSLLDNKNNYTE